MYTDIITRYINEAQRHEALLELCALQTPMSAISKKQKTNKFDLNTIKNVIFTAPATIVYWTDGSKTVVKCKPMDSYNPETGLAMCIIKKICGDKGNYNDVFNKWLPKEGE